MGKMGRTMTMTLSVHIDLELPPIKNVWVNIQGAIESFKYPKTLFPGLTLTAFSMSRCKEKKEEEDQVQRTGRHQVVAEYIDNFDMSSPPTERLMKYVSRSLTITLVHWLRRRIGMSGPQVFARTLQTLNQFLPAKLLTICQWFAVPVYAIYSFCIQLLPHLLRVCSGAWQVKNAFSIVPCCKKWMGELLFEKQLNTAQQGDDKKY